MTQTNHTLESAAPGQGEQPRDRTSHWDRTRFILDTLSREGHVDIEALAQELHVSAATVRRDLDGLALKQLLIRTRGGAVTNSSTYDLPIFYNAFRHAEEKRRIAQAAAARVAPGMVIGLNGGTTTMEIARSLALRADLERRDGTTSLTIVTNAVNIAHAADGPLAVSGGDDRGDCSTRVLMRRPGRSVSRRWLIWHSTR